VVEAALSWANPKTPYHDNACVKGHGIDCAWLLAAPFNEALGLSITVPRYPWQWHQAPQVKPEGVPYRSDEWYLEGLALGGFREIRESQVEAADLVISRLTERVYCHGGLIVSWPTRVLHCVYRSGGVVEANAHRSAYFRSPLKFFSRQEWHEAAESGKPNR